MKFSKNLGIWEGQTKGACEEMRAVRAARGTRLERLWVPD